MGSLADLVVRVDTSKGSIATEMLADPCRDLWGRGFTSGVIAKEVDPVCEPLGPKNKVVFAIGPLAGTLVPGANRLSVGCKSPLTGGIKESNAGGTLAFALGRVGIRGLIIEGDLSEGPPVAVYITARGDVQLVECDFLSAPSLYERADGLNRRFGRCAYAVVGPAADMLLPSAIIAVSGLEGKPTSFCARGGVGAALRSKGVAAVVVDMNRPCQRPWSLIGSGDKRSIRAILEMMASNLLTSETYRKFGTASVLDITNVVGGLPTRNFSRGKFEEASRVDSRALFNTIVSRGGEGTPSHACMPGCCVMCSNSYPGPDGREIVSPLEYETMGMLGPNCGIGTLDQIAMLSRACNDIGVDTIEIGAALGVMMDAGRLAFGDFTGALRKVEGIRYGLPEGRLLASGCTTVGKAVGAKRIPAVKGQAMAAYEPRAVKGLGVTYASSPMGADHTAGNTIRLPVNHSDKTGQAKASLEAQVNAALWDTLGICSFVTAGTRGDPEIWARLVSKVDGSERSLTEFRQKALDCLKIERHFNESAGLGSASVLPPWCYEEKNPDTESAFDISSEEILEEMRRVIG